MAKFHSLQFLCLALLVSMAAATQFRVGGSKGWTVPTEPNATSYNHWAQSHRFQIGDSLLFVYPPDQDSVLLVDEAAYKTCNTSSHIDIFDDGNTVFTLTRSSTFYFISGNHENCLKNESLIVVVMASRSNATIAIAPSPPPSPSLAPPPPPETLVHTPASSPAVQPTSPPSPSGVSSSKVVSFMSSFGAFLGVFISFVL
ncbi:early nodulin-like protein 3 [Dioscorea cayenensis subsp. rotundata]|uniref:Early nodulin-like protein 3 n=1 Tax=Dioscorea cayennensis subsp. rotundata TaxID=55577 RepID=A0AB40CL47_DIOCR|nr:early nodulin-like protein 3 [Dioscorea cayenensis subsp. rotundata]